MTSRKRRKDVSGRIRRAHHTEARKPGTRVSRSPYSYSARFYRLETVAQDARCMTVRKRSFWTHIHSGFCKDTGSRRVLDSPPKICCGGSRASSADYLSSSIFKIIRLRPAIAHSLVPRRPLGMPGGAARSRPSSTLSMWDCVMNIASCLRFASMGLARLALRRSGNGLTASDVFGVRWLDTAL